jgi:hypothetical protein
MLAFWCKTVANPAAETAPSSSKLAEYGAWILISLAMLLGFAVIGFRLSSFYVTPRHMALLQRDALVVEQALESGITAFKISDDGAIWALDP